MLNDAEILAQFVSTFGAVDGELVTWDPIPEELRVGPEVEDDAFQEKWRPLNVCGNRADLDRVYAALGTHFPPLFEQLVLNFRWMEVEIDPCRLCANPSADFFSTQGLYTNMTLDPTITRALLPKGYVRFAKGPDVCYDPVCFDTNRRNASGDCPVIQFEHESILCFGRIGETRELFPSFRKLVEAVVEASR